MLMIFFFFNILTWVRWIWFIHLSQVCNFFFQKMLLTWVAGHDKPSLSSVQKGFFFFLFLFFSKNANLDIVGYGLSIYLSCALQTQNPKFENQIIENTSQI